MKMIKKALHELFCRMAPRTYCLPFLTFLAKIKLVKLSLPFIHWYIAGSKYQREYEEAMRGKARLYIAYDGCFDLGQNFQQTVTRGWFFTALYCQGIVHPVMKAEIVTDHKEMFPLDYYLLRLNYHITKIKINVVNYWQLCTIYVLGLVIANLV